MKLYGIIDKSRVWFECCLSNRNQYIHTSENSKTNFEYITCAIPQGSILGPPLFLVYVNDQPNASRLLDPIMFCNDTNVFFSQDLFRVINNELVNIKDWFTVNKIFLDVDKTKYTFFHKPSQKVDIHISQPNLIINNCEIQRGESIKFAGVLLDQH